jgi:hypothetical protein
LLLTKKSKDDRMKKTLLCIMAGMLLTATGCKKSEETAETTPAETTASLTQEATEKLNEVTAQVTDKAAELTEKAAAFSVKAEDILAELNESVAAVQEKATTLDESQALAYAETYKDVLLEKKDQLTDVTAQVKDLSLLEAASSKGLVLKNQLAQYTTELSALKDRYNIYLAKLKSLGADISSLTLQDLISP